MSLFDGEEGEVGQVHGIFVTSGGQTMPKAKVAAAELTARGLVGDRQGSAVDEEWGGHGGPLKAVCCWSSDVVRQLQAEGHPLAEGACGENLLLSGLDWSKVVPGSRLTVGGVLLEVTQYSRPCPQQVDNFLKGKKGVLVISHMHAPARSRVYCAVLREGTVRTGDAARLHLDTLGAKPYSKNKDVLGTLACRGHITVLSTATHLAALAVGLALGWLAHPLGRPGLAARRG
mmetsp:Transcript_77729/g.202508  ORF Transcript_77729/g.202508 Transcript_77729/m.202508 type:complete len:231 (-) Transcript_77729:26-718(-)